MIGNQENHHTLRIFNLLAQRGFGAVATGRGQVTALDGWNLNGCFRGTSSGFRFGFLLFTRIFARVFRRFFFVVVTTAEFHGQITGFLGTLEFFPSTPELEIFGFGVYEKDLGIETPDLG